MAPVAAIVLAAGASRRLGTPKQLAFLGSETLLERAVRVAREAGLSPIFVVVREGLSIERTISGVVRVVNLEAAEGMASSIRAGVQALTALSASVPGAVLLACDQPAVTAWHLRQLAVGGEEVCASAYAGRVGVPAYFPRSAFHALLALQGDQGARHFLEDARTVELPGGELDVDTIDDLNRARRLYQQEALARPGRNT